MKSKSENLTSIVAAASSEPDRLIQRDNTFLIRKIEMALSKCIKCFLSVCYVVYVVC